MPQAILHATFVKNTAIGPGTRVVFTVEAPWRPPGEFVLREKDDVQRNWTTFNLLKNLLVSNDFFEMEDR